MTESTQALCQSLIERIFTTHTLKIISNTLEELSQNKPFKQHMHAIVSDASLTSAKKRAQLLYVVRGVEEPLLYDFFSDHISAKNFWLFEIEPIDYFDQFVQMFQQATETLEILFLTTAVALETDSIKAITADLSRSFGKKIIVQQEVNPAVIGGAVARMGNMVFDMSLRTRFTQFQQHWLSTLDKTSKNLGRFELEETPSDSSA